MIKTVKQRMKKDEEEGFTLIELLVVVLILGILMAIAIPTFLSLTSGAKQNAAESDLTTATQDEATYFTTNGSYDGTGASTPSAADNIQAGTANTSGSTLPGMKGIDPGLNWVSTSVPASTTAGQKTVGVTMLTSASTPALPTGGTAGQQIMLASVGQDGNIYAVQENAGTASYAILKSSVTALPATTSSDWKTSWNLANQAGPQAS